MKESVLLIDDDKVICQGVSTLLERRYMVEVALNGKEGIEKFLKTSPSMVFVDYLIPDMDGLEVVRKLKEISPEVGILFMTAYGNTGVVIEALRAGVFDYIEKPFVPEILLAAMRRLETFRMLQRQRYRLKIEEEKERERKKLFFSLRHELSNLLAIISGNVQLLEVGAVNQAKRESLTAIRTAVNDCLAIMNKLGDFARLRPQTHILQSLDINSLIMDVVSSLRYLFAETIRIVTHLGSCGRVKADPTEIREVIINVLNNACNAIKGEGDITISTLQEGDFVVVKISDTGPGIPEGLRGKLFRPFVSTGGTGIGLFWSRFILSQHGGTIDIESAPGEGATVVVKLPCEE
jgi:signal transduction histidine kinase